MHEIAQIIQFFAAPLVSAAEAIAPAIGVAAHRPAQSGDFTLAAFAVSIAIVGLACSWWAAWSHARLANFRIDRKHHASQMAGQIQFRDVLLQASGSSFVVLGADMMTPTSVGGASEMLGNCMSGPNGKPLAVLLNALLESGQPFETTAHMANRTRVAVRGYPVGGRAAVFFDKLQGEDASINYRAALDSLPIPVWIRQPDLSLSWANRAFLEISHSATLGGAIRANAVLERSEYDLAASARDGADIRNVRRYISTGTDRMALSVNLNRLPDATILGAAIDVSDNVRTEARLKSEITAYADLLDRVPLAAAAFGGDQRLSRYNSAYAQLWCLDPKWLDNRPSIGEILDRLRDAGRLPEQRDFRAWKIEHLRPFNDPGRYVQDVWHTAGERSIRVEAQPYLEGGVCFLFEDVSDQLRLQSRMSLLSKVQRATLDMFQEGIAIFGSDGRLAMHNAAFVRSWDLQESDLVQTPHLTKVADLCITRKGRDGIWNIVAAGVMSDEPQRYAEWGKVTRADGRIISVSLSPLPDGAISVMFKDLTDLERFTEELKGKPATAAA